MSNNDVTVANQETAKKAKIPRGVATVTILTVPLWFAPVGLALPEEDVHLAIEPRTVQVLPGEAARLKLTVQAGSAAPVRLHVPADPLLLLRAVEKLPVRRTREGVIVHQRVIILQGLEPGVARMKAIALETQGRKLLFPEITVSVTDPGP